MTHENNHGGQENVIADYANELQQIEIEGYQRGVKKARNALYLAGGLIFLAEMIGMFSEGLGIQPYLLMFAIVEAGIFIGLAFWTKKKPYTAVITGLVAFIGLIIFTVVVNGMVEGSAGVLKALFGGIIFKVIILVNLIVPIKDAKALQDALKQQY